MYEQYGGGQYCGTIAVLSLQFLWNMEANMYLDEEGKQEDRKSAKKWKYSQLQGSDCSLYQHWKLFSLWYCHKRSFINFKVVSETPATWSVTGANNHSLVCHWLVWFVVLCCVPVVHIATFTAKESSNNWTSCLISVFFGFAAGIGDILDQLGDE